MIHLLLIAEESQASACAAPLAASPDHKLVRKDDLATAGPLLATGIFDLVAVIDTAGEPPASRIPALRAAAGPVPLVFITTDASSVARTAPTPPAPISCCAPR